MNQRTAQYGFFLNAADQNITSAHTADRSSWLRPANGKPVRIKHPQGSHLGDVDQFQRMPREGTRYLSVLKTSGDVVFYTLTSAAGDVDFHGPLPQYRKEKLWALGWFPIGKCPCALVSTGELWPEHLADQSLVGATPCQPGTFSVEKPCPHTLKEQAARQVLQRETQAPLMQPNAHERMLAAQAQHSTAIADALKEALAPVANLASQAVERKGK